MNVNFKTKTCNKNGRLDQKTITRKINLRFCFTRVINFSYEHFSVESSYLLLLFFLKLKTIFNFALT